MKNIIRFFPGRYFWNCFVYYIPAALNSQVVLPEKPIYDYQVIVHPEVAKQGMVSTQNAIASKVGLNVLKKGGNAIDAAVAVGFALAVVLPRAGNLGGGGFMLIYSAKDKNVTAIDYREKAPLLAHQDMFLDENGRPVPEKSRSSYLAIGVPGTVAGLELALKKFGSISLQELIQPVIRLAEDGFKIDYDLEYSLLAAKDAMKKYPASMKIFFKKDKSHYKAGDKLIQKNLAWSLKKIARKGSYAFYRGIIANLIVLDMKKHGGLITLRDLQNYKPIIREPVQGVYKGHRIFSMPPPSSGGVHLIQMLNILEKYDIFSLGLNSAKTIHLMSEAMKVAYADRFKHLGDSDFAHVPVGRLISKEYADILRRKINLEYASPSKSVYPGDPNQVKKTSEATETTHFSIVDRWGNAVSNTYTLNFSYGMKAVAKGTGILLNNQMDDFTVKINEQNAYGLLGGEKNIIEPEKRMLSSMSPTIVLRDSEFFLATGSPGGSRIITTVLQIVLNVIDHKMNIAEGSMAPRIHHQWFPDILFMEKGISPDTIQILEHKGYTIKISRGMGSTQSIMKKNSLLFGFSDTRKPGALTMGY